MKKDIYNSIVGTIGCYLLANDWTQFFGYILVLEALLVSIEACMPRDQRSR